MLRSLTSTRTRDVKDVSWDPHSAFAEPAATDVDEVPDQLPMDEADVVFDEGDEARLLTFAGLETPPNRSMALRQRFSTDVDALLTRRIDDEVFLGSEISFRGFGGQLSVFAGVRDALLDTKDNAEPSLKLQNQQAVVDRFLSKTGSGSSSRREEHGDGLTVESADGCALRLRVEQ